MTASTAEQRKKAFSLHRPAPGCSGRLSYANAKTSGDRSIRIRRRACPECGLQVTDSAVYSREIMNREQP